MNYLNILELSADMANNIGCMGLDPQVQFLPNNITIAQFFQILFESMVEKKLTPSAFKPNICYYATLNKPRQKDFSGYIALSDIMGLINKYFPNIPIILDSKRADISTSSLKYAEEAFDCWQSDAITISPYMGSDSILPFRDHKYAEKGAYILNRTSNQGASDFQNLQISNKDYLYEYIAKSISSYAKTFPGTGAVVGATGMDELKQIATIYAKSGSVPLLIPGVGAQGGNATDVINVLKSVQYNIKIVRINSSSGLTFPWKKQGIAPANWLEMCINSIQQFLNDTKIN